MRPHWAGVRATDLVAIMAVHEVLSTRAAGDTSGAMEFIGSGCYRITRGTRVRSVAGTSGTAGTSRKAGNGDGQAGQRRPDFEQARDELTELVKRLEAGGLTLEQSLQLWERGEQLAAICEEWLEGARARMATAMARKENPGGSQDAPF